MNANSIESCAKGVREEWGKLLDSSLFEYDSKHAECCEQDTEHDGSDKEELLKATLCVEVLSTVCATERTTNARRRRLEKDCCDEES